MPLHKQKPKLFLGVGNLLKRDDGVGVRAAEILADLPLPDDVEVYDAGACGLELMYMLEHRDLIVVLDAIQTADKPGTLYRFIPDDLLPFKRCGLSVHDLHLLDSLETLKFLGTAPRKIVILAIRAGDVSTGMGLTPPVQASLARALALAAVELGLPPNIVAKLHNCSQTPFNN